MNMLAAASDSDAETVMTEGMVEGGKGDKEKREMGKVSQITVACGRAGRAASASRNRDVSGRAAAALGGLSRPCGVNLSDDSDIC